MEKKRGKEEGAVVNLLALGIIIILASYLFPLVYATPTGPTSIVNVTNETGILTSGVIINTSGGEVSTMNITAAVQNPHWKAFVGQVIGSFTLDDASGSTIYDWTLTSVGGEIYATRTSGSVTWGSIECANATIINAEDASLQQTGEDDINATFNGSTNSNPFVVGTTTINAGDCAALYTYINNNTQSTDFEEVILYDLSNVIFATILEQNTVGFDGNTYDFQMIVPENGSSTWASSTAYYIYVELS